MKLEILGQCLIKGALMHLTPDFRSTYSSSYYLIRSFCYEALLVLLTTWFYYFVSVMSHEACVGYRNKSELTFSAML